MEAFQVNIKKWAALVVGAVLIGMTATMFVRAAIQTEAGLAVANGTVWTPLKDAAFGDGATNGVALMSPALWNGSSFARAIGDATNGMKVNVTALAGSTTPADGFANPTTAITDFSLAAIWNGSTWDRLKEATGDALSATGLLATGNMGWNGTAWDRLQSDAARKGNLLVKNLDALTAFSNTATSGNVQLIALSGTTKIKIYSFLVDNSVVTAQNFKLTTGTGTACGTGTADLTATYALGTVETPVTWSGGGYAIVAPAGAAVCTNLSTATAIALTLVYVQE